MSTLGRTAWNRGKKMPHTAEWEENRLIAIRLAAKNRVYRQGYKRPKEHVQPMLDALTKKRLEHPEKYKKIAINNLPTDCSLERNGNWRGGRTKEARNFRIVESGKFDRWRKIVLSRDGYKCRDCGSTLRLEAHHIIPLMETRSTAFLPMNGVTLCKTCHKKTDTYGGLAKKHALLSEMGTRRSSAVEQLLGRIQCIARTIPHRFQAYPTVGNYSWTDDGILVIFVSDMHNDDYENLVLLHEYIEANLVRSRGIKIDDIDTFDIEFEKNRVEGNTDEPGWDPKAPYHKEHVFAEKIERLLAEELGVDWEDYDKTVVSL